MKRTSIRVLSVLALLLILTTVVSAAPAGMAGGPGNPDPAGQLVDLQLLAFNDYHGHLNPGDAGTVAHRVTDAILQRELLKVLTRNYFRKKRLGGVEDDL